MIQPELPITLNTLGKKLPFSSIYSCLAGLTLLQFFYDLKSAGDHSQLQNCEVNYVIPQFSFFPLDKAKSYTWQKFEVVGPLTVQGLIQDFSQRQPDLILKLVFCKGVLLYENITNSQNEHGEKVVEEIIRSMVPFCPKTKELILEYIVYDKSDTRVFFPLVRYSIKK